jgi:hypothetical protein
MLAMLDEFLRSDRPPELLAAHLHAAASDHPRYDAALLIDQVSFTAYPLRTHRHERPR